MASSLRRTLLVVVAATGVLAGCTTSEASETAALLLGDLTTIEPCSLTDPEVFAEFGDAEFGPPRALRQCAVLIKPNAADAVTIMIGELGRTSADHRGNPLPSKLEDVADSIYTTELDEGGFSCWQTLVFDEEDLTLDVSGHNPVGVDSPINTCDMVAAGMAKVVEVVLAGEVEHRTPEPNSLVSLDPCDLVTDETVTALPGFAAAQRMASPGGHGCRWRLPPGPEGRFEVSVTFSVGTMPTSREFHGLPSTSSTIAGRPSITMPFGTYCTVETGHIPFDEVEGATDIFETVQVYADTPPGQRDPAGQLDQDEREDVICEGAVAVATALWPRLPSA